MHAWGGKKQKSLYCACQKCFKQWKVFVVERTTIVFANVHWSNHGDEAALAAIVKQVKQVKKDAQVLLLVKDAQEIRDDIMKNLGVEWESNKFLPHYFDYIVQLLTRGKCGRNPQMKRFFEIMNSADYILYAPGGSVICDRFWWRKQLEYLAPFFCAKFYKKPMMVVAPSMGPFDTQYRMRNHIRKSAFQGADCFLLREKNSYDNLAAIKAERGVQVTVDSAFCADIDKAEQKKLLEQDLSLQSFLNQHQSVVGITITDLSWNVKFKSKSNLDSQIAQAMSGFIRHLRAHHVGVLLIPQLFSNQNDTDLLKQYVIDAGTYILDERYPADFQQYVISSIDMVIGMRYHSNIFAAKMGIPFLPIVYEEKMDYFIKDTCIERYKVDVESISEEALIQKYQLILAETEQYCDKLSTYQKLWRLRAEVTKEKLSQFLETENQNNEGENHARRKKRT